MDSFWNALANLINVIACGIIFAMVALLFSSKKEDK